MSRIVTFGEIMCRLATPGHQRFQQAMPGPLNTTFAGAEASIAAAIAYMGGDAAFVTALPCNPLADACIADLRSMGVDTSQVRRTESGRLGLYFLETGASQRAGNVIYDREGSSVAITPASAYDWDNIFSDAEWFIISGITPAISKNAAEVARSAMQAASKSGLKVVCDMNYRSKLWQWEKGTSPRDLATRTMRELMPLVTHFVGGREDAEHMLGIQDCTWPLQEVARQISQKYANLTHVAMTRREGTSASANAFGGMLYECASGHCFHAPSEDSLYPIPHIVDRLGAGDAFTAGLVYALYTAELSAPETAVAFAAASGCLAHSIEGDYNYISRQEIADLMSGSSGGRIRR